MHDHKNTEAFAIAIQDSVKDNMNTSRELGSNIVSMIYFRLLENAETPGAFIYYLGTLHNKPFHTIMPSSKAFQNVRCLVEGLGMGEFLLRLTQLFVKCVKNTGNLYLAINRTSVHIKFYRKLKFKVNSNAKQACEALGEEVSQCLSMEASDISVFKVLNR